MSTTDSPPPVSGPRVTGEQARDLGRLRRTTKQSPEGRHLGGVAGGLGRHFDVDPVIVRVALVVLVFFGGAGLLLYGACWLLVPEEGSERATIQLDDRTRSFALYVAAALATLALLGDTVGRFDFPWPIAIIALVVLVIVSRRDRFRAAPGQPDVTVPPPASYAAPYGAPTGPVGGPVAGPVAGPATGDPATGDTATGDTAVPAYDAPAGATATAPVGPPPVFARPVYVPPPNPRRRGPILFWFTLALIALLEGVLGIVDAAGASVAGPAYAALAVGVTGAMLVLGAFWGRAGGLILLGLISTLALVVNVAVDEADWSGDSEKIHLAPTSAAAVGSTHSIRTGELVVDLTGVRDVAALDGRRLDLEAKVGRIQVILPAGLSAEADARVSGPGHVVLWDDERGGWDTTLSRHHDAGVETPVLTITADLSVGEIDIESE